MDLLFQTACFVLDPFITKLSYLRSSLSTRWFPGELFMGRFVVFR